MSKQWRFRQTELGIGGHSFAEHARLPMHAAHTHRQASGIPGACLFPPNARLLTRCSGPGRQRRSPTRTPGTWRHRRHSAGSAPCPCTWKHIAGSRQNTLDHRPDTRFQPMVGALRRSRKQHAACCCKADCSFPASTHGPLPTHCLHWPSTRPQPWAHLVHAPSGSPSQRMHLSAGLRSSIWECIAMIAGGGSLCS